MQYQFDSMIELEKLDLYYEAHMVNLDGESFVYDIYLEDKLTNEKVEEIKKAIENFSETFNNNGDTYAGYIDIRQSGNVITIFLDIGNVIPENQIISIHGIFNTLNNVKGIKKVMINEL